MKSFFSFTLILSALLFCLLFAGCDDGSSNDNSSDDDANNDANDDVNDDTNDDDTSDDEQNPSPYEFAPTPSDEIGVFVAKTGSDDNPGTMDLPKLTISAGVEAAEFESKSIFVAEGEYHESVSASDVSFYGGYEVNTWERDIRNHQSNILAAGEFGIKIQEIESGRVIVEGFIITGGQNSETREIEYSSGVQLQGGIYILSKNIIHGGSSKYISSGIEGGTQAYVTIYDCHINGGSLNFERESNPPPFFVFTAGIYMGDRSYYTIINSVIEGGSGNYNPLSYGVFATDYSSLFTISSYIYGGDPMADYSRSYGIYLYSDVLSHPTLSVGLINNIIHSGSGELSSADLMLYNVIRAAVYGNNLWNDNSGCIYQYGLLGIMCMNSISEINEIDSLEFTMNYNISQTPVFINPEIDDFHLDSASPCRDAGVDIWVVENTLDYLGVDLDFYLPHINFDFDGDPRPYGEGWDIGPDEWTGQ